MLKPFSIRFFWLDLVRIIGLAALYAALGTLVLTHLVAPGNLSMLWPSSGLALAVLLLGGRRLWPGVFFGTIGACLSAGLPLLAAVFFACGNVLEAVLGHWWLVALGGQLRP